MKDSGKAVAEGDSIRSVILKGATVPAGTKTTVVNKNANYDAAILRLRKKGIEYRLIEDSPFRQVWGCDEKEFENMMRAGVAHRRTLVQEERKGPNTDVTRKRGTAMRLKDIGDQLPDTAPQGFEKVSDISGASPEE